MATKRATTGRAIGTGHTSVAAAKAEMQAEIERLRAENCKLQERNLILRQRVRGIEPGERLPNSFLGIDVGTLAISWARLDGEALDDFDTVELRSKKQTLDEGRRMLRMKLPDMLGRWCDGGGLPTVVAIEEPMFSVGSGAIHTSKALNTFKTMIEEALVVQGHVIVTVTPARWHGVVRSTATSKQMTKHRVVKKKRNLLDIKGLALELAMQESKDSTALVGVEGGLLQDEADAFWIAQRARFDYLSHVNSTVGEA